MKLTREQARAAAIAIQAGAEFVEFEIVAVVLLQAGTVCELIGDRVIARHDSLVSFMDAHAVLAFELLKFDDRIAIGDWHQQASLIAAMHGVASAAAYHQRQALNFYKDKTCEP